MFTIGDVPALSAERVSELILAEQNVAVPTYAIVDVRDGDYIGGHIKGSLHIASQVLQLELTDLVEELRNKKMVIFHCMLSQQRGPKAALQYMRRREEVFPGKTNAQASAQGERRPATGEGVAAGEPGQQTVCFLQGGFVEWVAQFANDERLTEGFRKEIWEDM